jgi:hypothetical protein
MPRRTNVGRNEPRAKPFIHANRDHATQLRTEVEEQLVDRWAVALDGPLHERADVFDGRCHDVSPNYLPTGRGRRLRKMSPVIGGARLKPVKDKALLLAALAG